MEVALNHPFKIMFIGFSPKKHQAVWDTPMTSWFDPQLLVTMIHPEIQGAPCSSPTSPAAEIRAPKRPGEVGEVLLWNSKCLVNKGWNINLRSREITYTHDSFDSHQLDKFCLHMMPNLHFWRLEFPWNQSFNVIFLLFDPSRTANRLKVRHCPRKQPSLIPVKLTNQCKS